MSAILLSFLAALPLAFAAPYSRPNFWGGCGQADGSCSRPVATLKPSWSHGPYLPSGCSDGAALPMGTGYGTAPWGTGTGHPIYPTGTAAGTGVMSILPVDVSSSTLVYTNSIHSSASISTETVVTTTHEPSATMTGPVGAPGPYTSTVTEGAEPSDDSVKAQFSASTTFTFGSSGALPTGLRVSTDFISSKPLTHTFKKSNVKVEDGFLVLNVPGGQAGKSDITSAEISTTFNVKYASVRTFAILTEEPGVCNGMFFYESDSQETDIEWISDPKSQSNKFANNGTRAMQYTNQALNGDFDDATSAYGRSPDDATSAVHEYRLDWFKDRTEFFVDGVFQYKLTTNVPTASGPWVWNNWADGNPGWTAAPPKNDAPFKIQKIEMYYNPA